MKKILTLGVALLLLAGAAGAAEGIVFVDLERTFNEFYKTQLAKSKMEVQQKDIDAEFQVLAQEMDQISDEVDVLKKEARDVTLSQEVRDQKRILFEESVLELRGKQKEIGEFNERRKQQMQMQVARMSKTIMDEIRGSIIDYAQQEGLSAVIDNSVRAAAVGVFIYTHPDVDITEDILVMLNSKRPDVLAGEDDATETANEGASEEE